MKYQSQSPLNSINLSADTYSRIASVCNDSSTNVNHRLSCKEYLLNLLNDLDGIQQDPFYHPEIDTLYHSLQVFQLARLKTNNSFLLAAALLHDVGKSIAMAQHEIIGAEMLKGVLAEPIPWLVEHHLDLLKHPKRTRKKRANSIELSWLEKLRIWDIQGRKTDVEVVHPEQAIDIIIQTDEIFQY